MCILFKNDAFAVAPLVQMSNPYAKDCNDVIDF